MKSARALGPRLWSLVCAVVVLAWLVGCSRKAEDKVAQGEAPSGAMDDRKEEEAGMAFAVEKAEAEGKDDEPAGPKGWKRSVIDTHKIRIAVGDEETLPVDALAVHARVDGFRARVVLDVDFHNPNSWQLEGNFSLRLPEGASPYFLAFGGRVETAPQAGPEPDEDDPASFTPDGILDQRRQVWSDPAQLKTAVMVERDQAKVAYRNTVRRNVDPALSEWAGSGVFNTRLFPIAANSTQRVVIGYDVDLLEVGDGLSLPIIVPEDAATRSLDLVVTAGKGAKVSLAAFADDAEDAEPIEPQKLKTGLRYRLADPPAQLELALSGSGNLALVGSEADTGDYFAARVAPTLPKQKTRVGASRAVFAVDVSLSANPDKFNVWLDILEATLEQNRDQIEEFAVLAFNVEQFWWTPGFAANTPEQVAQLKAFLDTLALEGATDLGAALAEAARPSWSPPDAGAPDWDLFLLSDGAATWGEPDAERVLRDLRAAFPGRVFCYRTGLSGTELQALDRLAAQTGGAVFAVTGPDQVAAAATAHRAVPWELVSISAVGIEDLLVAGAPRFLYPGQVLIVAGREIPDGGGRVDAIELKLAQAGAQAGVEKTVKIGLPPPIASELAPRIYGQLATTALERFHGLGQPGQGAVESLAYARHFRVTGKAASLLMLESEADFDRAGLSPAEAEIRDAKIVVEQPVAPQLAQAEQWLTSQLGDPRAALLAMLARVRELTAPEADAGASASALGSLEQVIRQLPDASFDVEIPRLVCARHDREVIDKRIFEQLRTRELIYDDLVAAAEHRRQQVGPADAVKALSSLVEANPGDTVMARDVAFTAREWGQGAHVYQLLRRVARTRPEEPQTYLALGGLAAQIGALDLAMIYHELALSGGWEQRFGDVHEIAAVEYLRFLGQADLATLANPDLARSRKAQLGDHLPVRRADLLVIMTWNTDNTDIDLHVLEPSGEDCYYGNRSTKAGGQMSTDVTQGFGPEMYYIPKARSGAYEIRAHYYASDRNRLSTRTKAYVTVFEDFGSPRERVFQKVVALTGGKENHEILTVKR